MVTWSRHVWSWVRMSAMVVMVRGVSDVVLYVLVSLYFIHVN